MTAIKIFDVDYKAVSNLFVETFEEHSFCFPAPTRLHVTIGKEDSDSGVSELKLTCQSYLDSPFIVDYYLDLFFYVLGNDFQLSTFLFKQISMKETSLDMDGYSGTYIFNPSLVVNNICLWDNSKIYLDYLKHETSTNQQRRSTS